MCFQLQRMSTLLISFSSDWTPFGLCSAVSDVHSALVHNLCHEHLFSHYYMEQHSTHLVWLLVPFQPSLVQMVSVRNLAWGLCAHGGAPEANQNVGSRSQSIYAWERKHTVPLVPECACAQSPFSPPAHGAGIALLLSRISSSTPCSQFPQGCR